jgi:glycine hydroxymethyltransferase
MSVVTQDILDIVQNQQRWRRQECINLIASENVQSPAVQQIEGNDFMCRYA